MPVPISALFDDEPIQWAFRGDPWLWREMRERFTGMPSPATADELVAAIAAMFRELTGEPLTYEKSIFVERYSHGGMSSGRVDPEFWREKAIPLLLSRYKDS